MITSPSVPLPSFPAIMPSADKVESVIFTSPSAEIEPPVVMLALSIVKSALVLGSDVLTSMFPETVTGLSFTLCC